MYTCEAASESKFVDKGQEGLAGSLPQAPLSSFVARAFGVTAGLEAEKVSLSPMLRKRTS